VTWVAWRLQRTESLIALGILAAVTLFLLPSGLDMASTYHRDGLAACLAGQSTAPCQEAIDSFTSQFESTGNLVAWLTLLPGLLGVLLATPFVLDLEHGTYRLAWTQSITRRRWIATKLGLASAATLLAALGLIVLLRWWRAPLVHLHGRMDPAAFDSQGTVVLGYTLFALGLAVAMGVLWRRAVPALVVGFAAYFASRLFVDLWLRQRLVPPLSATWSANGSQPAGYATGWIITEYPSDRLGRHAPLSTFCARGARSCFVKPHATFIHGVYEPASRFWLMQGVETALFGGVALALLAFAAWWTHRRVA
jgi:hypothetical protein